MRVERKDNPQDLKWSLRKKKITQVFEEFSATSPVFETLALEDRGDEIRAVAKFHTPTLVKRPGEEVTLEGPCVCGIRYHRKFQSEAPIPWEIVVIFEPMHIFHPNANPIQCLCLGHPMANVNMVTVLHQVWAALTFNMRLVTTEDWNVFNRRAAAYVRSRPQDFPLTMRGLLEPVESTETGDVIV